MSYVENDSVDVQALTEVLTALKKLDRDGQVRLLQSVWTFLGLAPPSGKSGIDQKPNDTSHQSGRVQTFSADRSLSPKDFLLDKQPHTDVERVACLAYYLTHYRNTPHLQTLDISKLNTEAAQIKLSNAAFAVNNAVQSGYLVAAPNGKKQLSAAGERFVEALPDRDAAKSTMDKARPRRMSRKGRSKVKAAEG